MSVPRPRRSRFGCRRLSSSTAAYLLGNHHGCSTAAAASGSNAATRGRLHCASRYSLGEEVARRKPLLTGPSTGARTRSTGRELGVRFRRDRRRGAPAGRSPEAVMLFPPGDESLDARVAPAPAATEADRASHRRVAAKQVPSAVASRERKATGNSGLETYRLRPHSGTQAVWTTVAGCRRRTSSPLPGGCVVAA